MKKLRFILFVYLFFVVFCFTVQAQPIPGEYTLQGAAAGEWKEFLLDGKEGNPGNQIFAEKDTLYQFGTDNFESDDLRPVLSRVMLKQVTLLSEPGLSEYDDDLFFLYQTLYNGGLLILFNNPRIGWFNDQEDDGKAFLATLGVSKVVTKKFVETVDNGEPDAEVTPTGEIEFWLSTTAQFGEYPGYKARIFAHFNRAVPAMDNVDSSDNKIMSGDLDEVKITIIGPADEKPVEIPFDIKPGSCRNPLNVKSQGVLPAVIPGTDTLDVRDIDPNTIKVLVDGDPKKVVNPIRWAIEDVIALNRVNNDIRDKDYYDDNYDDDCDNEYRDGKNDLELKFNTQDIVKLIDDPYDGQVVRLILMAELTDDTKVVGEDSVTLLVKGRYLDRELVKGFIKRFYRLCVKRDPDQAGWDYWVNSLKDGSRSGADVARGFVFSQEFMNMRTSKEEYLDVLYHAFFDRAPDSGGRDYWLSEFNSGASREEVLNGFIYAQEFSNLCDEYGITPN